MAITLSQEARKQLIASIKRYFDEEMDEELGDLRAGRILDYVLKEIAPTVYNQAIADAQAYFQDKALDLDGSCHEPEFGYWR